MKKTIMYQGVKVTFDEIMNRFISFSVTTIEEFQSLFNCVMEDYTADCGEWRITYKRIGRVKKAKKKVAKKVTKKVSKKKKAI